MGLCSKQRACVRNNGLMLEMMGSCSKQRAHVRNDGVMFEMVGLCLKGWGGGSEWRAHV